MDEDERAEWSARIAAVNKDVVTSKARIENVVIDARRAGCSRESAGRSLQGFLDSRTVRL